MPPKKRIPKRDSTELLEDIKLDSPDAKELLANLRRTCLADENIERLWVPQTIKVVQNPELQKNYEQRKKELREKGRKGKEIEDKIVFAPDNWAGIQKTCKFGIRCMENNRQILGDAKHGVHLSRHYDILLRFMAFKNVAKVRYVIIFKAMFGKTKAVTAKLTEDQDAIEPIPNFDSHISNVKSDIQMDMYDGFGHNCIYLYEYDEETSYPVQYPRHILPYAVIQLSRTQQSIELPMKWGGARRTMKNKNGMQMTQRKTWNSRAAAHSVAGCITAKSPLESEKSNIADDVKSTPDVNSLKTIESSWKDLDIKPCTIELFRSDMDIDDRIKIPIDFKFDTASGTALIATKAGFVKETRLMRDENKDNVSEPISDEIGMQHESQIKQEPVDIDMRYPPVTALIATKTGFVAETLIRGENKDNVPEPVSDKVSTLHESQIKQEPVDIDMRYPPPVTQIKSSTCSINIKQESIHTDYDKPPGSDSQITSQNEPSGLPLDEIASNKEVILKRLHEVEREIHWKKQKIDELQKKSNKTDISSTQQLESSVSSENVADTKQKYDVTDLCAKQNSVVRNLSLSLDEREPTNSGSSDEGDSTPTLDEHNDGSLVNIDASGKMPVFCSNKSPLSPTAPINPRDSLKSIKSTTMDGRKNIFDAYNTTEININRPLSPYRRHTVDLPSNPHVVTTVTNVTLGVSTTRPNLLLNIPSSSSSSGVKINELNLPHTSLVTSADLTSNQMYQKHSPLDVFKSEKKCSPFLAKYLEKKMSLGSLSDLKTENENSLNYSIPISDGNTQQEKQLENDCLLPMVENVTPQNDDSMPTLSPVTTKSNDKPSFDFAATFANIKKIMETGKLPSDSSPNRVNWIQNTGQMRGNLSPDKCTGSETTTDSRNQVTYLKASVPSPDKSVIAPTICETASTVLHSEKPLWPQTSVKVISSFSSPKISATQFSAQMIPSVSSPEIANTQKPVDIISLSSVPGVRRPQIPAEIPSSNSIQVIPKTQKPFESISSISSPIIPATQKSVEAISSVSSTGIPTSQKFDILPSMQSPDKTSRSPNKVLNSRDPRLLRSQDQLKKVVDDGGFDLVDKVSSALPVSTASKEMLDEKLSKSPNFKTDAASKEDSNAVVPKWLPGVLVSNSKKESGVEETNVKDLNSRCGETSKDESVQSSLSKGKDYVEGHPKNVESRDSSVQDQVGSTVKEGLVPSRIEVVTGRTLKHHRSEFPKERTLVSCHQRDDNSSEITSNSENEENSVRESETNDDVELPQNMKVEMQKTLQQLGDAIKVMQTRCGSNTDHVSSVEAPCASDEVSSSKEGSVTSSSFPKTTDKPIQHTIIDSSDLERTNRLLTNVFNSDMQTSKTITNIQQIQTVVTTNVKTTGYSREYCGFDATEYSESVEMEKEATKKRLKYSSKGARRPYSKWAEEMRLKAVARQKKLYKSKLVKRFGYDNMKRSQEMEKPRMEVKQSEVSVTDDKMSTYSATRSKEGDCSRSRTHDSRSRSRSKSKRRSSPKSIHSRDSRRDEETRRHSRGHSSGKKRSHSESKSDQHMSPKRFRKAVSPIRDRRFMSFKERGRLLYKLKNGYELSYWDREKLYYNRYRFQQSRYLVAKALKRDRMSSIRKKFQMKYNQMYNVSFGKFKKFGNVGRTGLKEKTQKLPLNKYDSKNTVERNPEESRSFTRNRDTTNSDLGFKGPSSFRSLNSPTKSKDFRERNSRERTYFKYDSNPSERRNDRHYLERDRHTVGRNDSRFLSSRNSEAGQSRSHDGERDKEKTLSKTMTSLLSKIIQGDTAKTDNTTEGQMANMIYQLMKQKVQNETVSSLSQNISFASPVVQNPGVDIQSSLIDYQLSRQQNTDIYKSTRETETTDRRSRYDDRSDRSFVDRKFPSESKGTSSNFEFKNRFNPRESRESYHSSRDRSPDYKSRYSSHSNMRSNGGRGFPSSSRGFPSNRQGFTNNRQGFTNNRRWFPNYKRYPERGGFNPNFRNRYDGGRYNSFHKDVGFRHRPESSSSSSKSSRSESKSHSHSHDYKKY